MKNLLKLTLIAVLSLTASQAFGQKFGYINTQELIIAMPETDSVNVKLESLSQEWSEQLELIQVEFNNKAQDYQKNVSTYTDAQKQAKEQELNDLNQRFQEFQNLAAQNMQQKQQELLAPIIEKAQNAIKKVGTDNGFTFVLDTATTPMLYWDETSVINLLPLVRAELGLPETAPAQ